jgi:hypothetical protein
MTDMYENTPWIRTKPRVIFSVTIFLLHYIVHMEAASPCETSVNYLTINMVSWARRLHIWSYD